MRVIIRPNSRLVIAVLLIVVALATGRLIAGAIEQAQETTESPPPSGEQSLPDFQPSERLPADSAVAFPTDI
jgi:hypothetical protein